MYLGDYMHINHGTLVVDYGLEDKIPSLYGMVKVGLDGTQGFVLDELMTRNNQPADAGCLRCGARQQESLVIQN